MCDIRVVAYSGGPWQFCVRPGPGEEALLESGTFDSNNDFGAEEIFQDEDGIIIYAPFESFGAIQKELEDRSIEILSSGFERIPTTTTTLNEEQVADIEKLLEKIEEDDDVQNVYHSMQE